MPERGARLTLDHVGHRYGSAQVVQDINLDVAPGEFVTLLGPSGCGKSTLLRILSGLLEQTEGVVKIDERDVRGLSPAERGVGIVFQSYALFPHMTVAANVAYGLHARGMGQRSHIRQVVGQMLETVRLSALAGRYPRELSGGQQQRVALARTLAVSPRILLLDEPLGALDKNLRLDMQIEIRRLQREFKITTIMVTHDQEEALGMSDRVAVLNDGQLEQFDTPEAIYDRPASAFVATFVGTANMLPASLLRAAHGFTVALRVGGSLGLTTAFPCSRIGPVVLAVRPEQWLLDSSEGAAPEALAATVELVMPLGPSLVAELSLRDGTRIKLVMPRAGAPVLANGMTVRLTLREDCTPSVFINPERPEFSPSVS